MYIHYTRCTEARCVTYVKQVESGVKSQQRESNGFDSTFLLCPTIALPSQRSMDSGSLDCVSRLDTISIDV